MLFEKKKKKERKKAYGPLHKINKQSPNSKKYIATWEHQMINLRILKSRSTLTKLFLKYFWTICEAFVKLG